jgi:dihydroorotase
MKLVGAGILTMAQLVQKMAVNPAAIIRRNGGSLVPGSDADAVIVDPRRECRVQAAGFLSKGKNTPFDGWQLPASVTVTICRGKVHTWE